MTIIRIVRARNTDPFTSHEAYPSEASRSRVRKQVLSFLTDHPKGLTDEQLLNMCKELDPNVAESSPRKRRGDLVAEGLVEQAHDNDGNPITAISSRRQRVLVWRVVR